MAGSRYVLKENEFTEHKQVSKKAIQSYSKDVSQSIQEAKTARNMCNLLSDKDKVKV